MEIRVACIWTVSRYKTKPPSVVLIGDKTKKLRVDPKNCGLSEEGGCIGTIK
ncbi:MAG: hypothetical protein GIS02_06465 [Methanosarcinales archaeon]|uniref:Uncharacterized protein n=1 Tax=Candidatus Ethanoperedens thermophilum TaxID=2766897 RepID=A0A848DBB6_9EURY|nr:hypothetical protein [Candidatus Ethanoperedens thermophilum]